MALFRIEGILLFVSVDEIGEIEDGIRRSENQIISCESREIRDHRHEIARILCVIVGDARLDFIPFNHFHHQYSFEIGLTITPANTVDGVRESLSDTGFEFEFGYFDDAETECYLIPRWNDRYTPFVVSSYIDTDKNPYLSGIRRIAFQVKQESFDPTAHIANLVDSPDRFSISSGNSKRFISVEIGLPSSREPIAERLVAGSIHLDVTDTTMSCSIAT